MNVLAILGEKKPAETPPGRRIYAVGDIHGRSDLLAALLERIRADCADRSFDGAPILIFVGDYIDRGLQSRAVIDRLLTLLDEDYEAHFLKGNHEAALLEFLERPETGAMWFAIGAPKRCFRMAYQRRSRARRQRNGASPRAPCVRRSRPRTSGFSRA